MKSPSISPELGEVPGPKLGAQPKRDSASDSNRDAQLGMPDIGSFDMTLKSLN